MKKNTQAQTTLHRVRVGARRIMQGLRLQVVPQIVLKGKWLADCGFSPGHYILVMALHNRLIISPEGQLPLLEDWADADTFVRLPGGQYLPMLPPIL